MDMWYLIWLLLAMMAVYAGVRAALTIDVGGQ